MNVRILKAEWGQEAGRYVTYEVRVLVGSIKTGNVLTTRYTADAELHRSNQNGYREYIEKLIHRDVGMALMDALLKTAPKTSLSL